MKLENRFTVPVPRPDAWRVLLDVERIAPCMPGAKLLTRDGDSFTGQVKVKVGPINLTYGGSASFISLDEAAGVAVIEGTGKETRGTGTAKATITCRLLDHGATTDIEVDTDLSVTGKPASFGRGVLADVSAKLVDQFAACLSDEIQQGGVDGDTAADAPADEVPAAGAGGAQADDATVLGGGPTGIAAMDDTAEDVMPSPGSQTTAPTAATAYAPPPAVPTPSGTAATPTAGTPTAATPTAVTPTDGTPTSPAGTATAPRRPRPEAEPIDLVGTAGLPVLKRAWPVLALLAVAAVLAARRRR